MPVTFIIAGVVVVAAGALLALSRRGKGGAKATGKATVDSLQARLDKELARAAAVEAFEKLMETETRAGAAAARVGELEGEGRLRLSSGVLARLAVLLAEEGQHEQALNWIEQSQERDASYFRTLNAAIAFEVTRSTTGHAKLPQYPFQYVAPPDPDATILLQAQLLHNLERPAQVDAVLAEGIAKSSFRFLRAQCRRLSGRSKEALADYKVLTPEDAEYEEAQQWIAELSAPATAAPTGNQKPVAGAKPATTPAATERTGPVSKAAPTSEKTAPVAKTAVPTSEKTAPVAKAAAPTSEKTAPVAKAAAPEPHEDPPPPPREPKRALATPVWNNAFDARAVLGVGPSSTLEEVRSAYLTLTKLHHPDRVATKGTAQKAAAEERMRDINRAWRELTRSDEIPTA